MKFKSQENALIWESWMGRDTTPPFDDNEGLSEYDEDPFIGQEDAETVISLEPIDTVEPSLEMDNDMDTELDDIDDDELDNEIILKSLRKLVKRAEIIMDHCQSQDLDTWMVAKIIKAEDYISDVWNELDDVADFANDGFEDAM